MLRWPGHRQAWDRPPRNTSYSDRGRTEEVVTEIVVRRDILTGSVSSVTTRPAADLERHAGQQFCLSDMASSIAILALNAPARWSGLGCSTGPGQRPRRRRYYPRSEPSIQLDRVRAPLHVVPMDQPTSQRSASRFALQRQDQPVCQNLRSERQTTIFLRQQHWQFGIFLTLYSPAQTLLRTVR